MCLDHVLLQKKSCVFDSQYMKHSVLQRHLVLNKQRVSKQDYLCQRGISTTVYFGCKKGDLTRKELICYKDRSNKIIYVILFWLKIHLTLFNVSESKLHVIKLT